MNLWQRYLSKQLIATFLLILFSVFSLFILVDLSEHSAGFFGSNQIPIHAILSYYAATFLVYLDFFFPLSFLLATLKVLLDLNSHQELVALQMAGLSKKKILFPFVLLAASLSLFSYINGEWLIPSSSELVNGFRNTHAKKKKKLHTEHLHALSLEDHSELLYQSYDPTKQELFDVIWIRSKKEIWRLETLTLPSKQAQNVELLSQKNLNWKREERFAERIMDEIGLEPHAMERLRPIQHRSLTSLFRHFRTHLPDQPIAEAHFFYKLMRPLLPFFVLLASAPLAMRFGRGKSHIQFIALSLALFFAFMTLLDGMLLIGETHLLSGKVAILLPFTLLISTSFRPFMKMC